MQLPKRTPRGFDHRGHPDAVEYLSEDGLQALRRKIKRLQDDLPSATEDVSVAVQKGDLSENAEYQVARSRLTRMQNQILSLSERLKRVVIIEATVQHETVQIGSRVTVESEGHRLTYTIVGVSEANPAKKLLSYQSPIGKALLNHRKGDVVAYETPRGIRNMTIQDIG